MHPMLNTAVKAARRAGAIINRAGLDLEHLNVARKGPKDYVTEVDRAAEEAIIDILRTAYPDHAFLGEESGAQGAAPNEVPEYQWVIDPLDGTTNFIHGFSHYAVSIALLHRGRSAHACIYDPTRNELFTTSRGAGAFLNNRRMRVASTMHYEDALLGYHIPQRVVCAPGSSYATLLSDCAAVRHAGSTVLDLAWVAAGRLDGFCGLRLKPWDLAAGSLLVLEAGGLLADPQGEQQWMSTGDVLAGAPKIFAQMIARLSH